MGAVGAGEESSFDQAAEIFGINVFGLMRMTNAVLPYMRVQGSGRVVNVSSVLGVILAPFMAVYAATKHAVEGYSESVDHELREHGIRMLLVEPAYTSTAFEASSMAPDSPLPVYARQREIAREVLATALRSADAPDVVAKVIVAAATDSRPKASLHRRVGGRTRQPAAPIRPRRRLRQADPQAQPGCCLTRNAPTA